MPRHSASVQSTTTTTHSFVGLAQPTRPPTGVVIPPRARPVGRPDVGYSESCVMASEDSGAVDGGVGTFSSDAVASLSASVEGLQLSRRRPDFTLPPMHPGLRLSSSAPLVAASEAGGGERVFCDRCRSNRRFFCHACLVPLVDDVPVVRLPFRAYFITDEKEKRSKATGAQCAILAPSQVTLCRPDHLPPLDPRRTVLLFPEKGAMSVEDVVAALAPRRSSDERRREARRRCRSTLRARRRRDHRQQMGRRDAHLQIRDAPKPSPRDVGATSHRLLAFPPAAEESAETRRRGFASRGGRGRRRRAALLARGALFLREGVSRGRWDDVRRRRRGWHVRMPRRSLLVLRASARRSREVGVESRVSSDAAAAEKGENRAKNPGETRGGGRGRGRNTRNSG